MKWDNGVCCLFVVLSLAFGCTEGKGVKSTQDHPQNASVERPEFSADSAYAYIEQQVGFGPRVPGSEAHQRCAEWLESKLSSFGATVQVQTASAKRYDNKELPVYNIIASFRPDASERLLLCAHWDTRHIADQDVYRSEEPIPGANDGGSGVGVLLEIARQLQQRSPDKGVDIILFDAEDQGQPDGMRFKPDTYCLGSQYWSRRPHVPGYRAKAGILLDMVGARNAVFTLEGTSMQYAPGWMRKVWDNATLLGHTAYFSYERTPPITDDHLYINRIRKIPTIDIIQHDFRTQTGFGEYWHRHDDNMEIIDRNTLRAVGETVLATVYAF